FHGFVFVVHGESDRLRVAFLPEPPVGYQSWLRLKPGSPFGAIEGHAGQAGIERAILALDHHDAVTPAVEAERSAARSKSACEAGVGVVHEQPPTIVEDSIGIEEKAQGNGAVIDVTVRLNLHPAKHAVVRAQVLFTAVGLNLAMGTVRMEQGW